MFGDIIILHMCTIYDNHMMYGSWDIKHDRQNFLTFCVIFCPFTKLTTLKIKILKKWKKNTWRYHHFIIVCIKVSVPPQKQPPPPAERRGVHTMFMQVHQKSWSYAILFLRYGTWRNYFLFCPFAQITAQKMKVF